MMTKETVWVEFLGGPYDGHSIPVDLVDGRLPDTYIHRTIGPVDYSRSPMDGPAAGMNHDFYTLDVSFRDGAPHQVYRYEGGTIQDIAA